MALAFQCPCGRSLIADDAHRGREVKCPACGRALLVPQVPGATAQEAGAGSPGMPMPVAPVPPQAEPLPQRPGLPWERRDEIGAFPSAFRTIQLVLLEPSAAFSAMRGTPVGGAVLFYALFAIPGALLCAAWNLTLKTFILTLMSRLGLPLPPDAVRLLFQSMAGLFLIPFTTLLALFIGAALLHLGLLMTGAKRRGFETTLGVYAYVQGSAALFLCLPCCGLVVSSLWATGCLIIGLVHAHGCETWKALLAVLWPLLLCCCCGGAAFALAVATGALAHAPWPH